MSRCRAMLRVGEAAFGCELEAPHPGLAHTATGWQSDGTLTAALTGRETPLHWCSDGEARQHGKALR